MSRRSDSTRSEAGAPFVSPETLDRVFGALAHPARRRMLTTLHARGGRMTAGEIADRFRHSWPTTTRHLRVLSDAELVDIEEEGRNRLYSSRPQALQEVVAWLARGIAQPLGGRGRAPWAELGYATLRNAIREPGGDDGAADEG